MARGQARPRAVRLEACQVGRPGVTGLLAEALDRYLVGLLEQHAHTADGIGVTSGAPGHEAVLDRAVVDQRRASQPAGEPDQARHLLLGIEACKPDQAERLGAGPVHGAGLPLATDARADRAASSPVRDPGVVIGCRLVGLPRWRSDRQVVQ